MYIVFHNYVAFLGMKYLLNSYIPFSLETNCIYFAGTFVSLQTSLNYQKTADHFFHM